MKIQKKDFVISKLKYFKDSKLRYTLNETKISNMKITKGFLKVNNNPELLNFIKRKFNIEMIGDSDFNIFLSDEIKKLDFNFSLRSNLKNTFLNIDYLDIIKKNNIESL